MSNRDPKRKIQDTSLEVEGEEVGKIFQKSKLVSRSPEKKKEREMEQILQVINQMRTEMKEGFQNTNSQNEMLKAELEKTNRELKQIKQELMTKEKEWIEEKSGLKNRITELEDRMEKEDKNRRRNNIIVKGAKIKGENIKTEIEGFIKEKMNITIQIREAYEINKGVVVAKVEDWAEKRQLMMNKSRLRGTNTYIDNDLTKKEMSIQKQLRDIAKQEREKGSIVKVGYQKIIINEKCLMWEEIKTGTNYRQGMEEEPENTGNISNKPEANNSGRAEDIVETRKSEDEKLTAKLSFFAHGSRPAQHRKLSQQ